MMKLKSTRPSDFAVVTCVGLFLPLECKLFESENPAYLLELPSFCSPYVVVMK